MGNKESTMSDGKDADQPSAQYESPTTYQQIDLKTVKNNLLIWLDGNIDEESNAEYKRMITQLKRFVETVKTFTDSDQCVEFILTLENETVYMITSGSLGQRIVPRISPLRQMNWIFVFCGDQNRHEQWAKEWSKVKGVFTKIEPIYDALKELVEGSEEEDTLLINVDASNKDLDRLEPSFMYTKILKEILLTITFEEKHFEEFIDYCREEFAENQSEISNINEFERDYRKQSPIWWYTYESFIYPMLNRALRQMDVDIIVKMGLFIRDLHYQIAQLHKIQFGSHDSAKSLTVYRGQGFSKHDFEHLVKNKGGLLSFNGFLSTTKDRQIALSCTRYAGTNLDLVGVLFVMVVNPSTSTVPLASTKNVSYRQHTAEEILFSMHTIFRVHDIKSLETSSRLFQVNLTLTNDEDKDLGILTDRIRKEISSVSNGWHRLGLFRLQIGQNDKAQQIFEALLERTDDIMGKGTIHSQLGRVKVNQGEYQKAILCFEEALEIKRKHLPPNHPDLTSCYANIGNVSCDMGDYPKALSYCERALEIQEKTLPPNHPDLASSLNNIGSVNSNIGNYSKALSYYEKALVIQQQSLPSNHPDLASSYNDIGSVYSKKNNYSKALSYYKKAVQIGQQSLPPSHFLLEKYKENVQKMRNKL